MKPANWPFPWGHGPDFQPNLIGVNMTNAPVKPEFEGQIVKFKSPYADVWLFDICKRNPKYGWLEWWALNDPTPDQQAQAMIAS